MTPHDLYASPMHRPDADPANMQLADFLCDTCHRAWDGQFPMVEGHQGALVCGNCLTIAYTEVVLNDLDAAPAGVSCRLCLEERDEPHWLSPVDDEAAVCRRCIKQAAGRLHKDADWEWTKPGG